ncbi:MAG TPA: insulinase family protein [Streptosporangiaceae bacterium]|nr:insulinase family protein [Streptosporangiaceae bacterium]
MTALPEPGLSERLASLAEISPAAVPVTDARLHVIRAAGASVYAQAGMPRPIVAVRLYWPGGSAMEDAGLSGLHAVTMQALIRSPAPGGKTTMAEHLESAGVAVAAGATDRTAYLELRGPREYLSNALTLAATAVAAAEVDEGAFQAARKQALHGSRRRQRDLAMLAGDAFRAARAAPGNFLARRPGGSAVSLDGISVADCRALAAGLWGRRLHLVIVGDQRADDYLAAVSALTSGDGERGDGVAEPPALCAEPPGELRAASGSAAHSYLGWGTAAGTADIADHVAIELAAHLLGGWSGSRWNALFRERLGLTYSVASAHTSLSIGSLSSGDPACCLAQVGFSVATKDLATALDLLRRDIEDFVSTGPSPDGVNAAAVQLLRMEAHFHDSARKMVARVGGLLQAGLGPDFAERRISVLRAIRADETRDRMAALLRQSTLIVLSDAPE